MKAQPPIPEDLWNQVPPAAQAAILSLILSYEQQLRSAQSQSLAPVPPPPAAARTAPARAVESSPMTALVGTTISHYEIGQLVASGNSGSIFRARDTQADRVVAVQVIRPEATGGDDDKIKFGQAMQVVRALRHPNLVRVFSAGKSGPYRWIAMRYVEGESLAQVLRKAGVAGQFDWRSSHAVAVAIVGGLIEVHRNKILHRNVKPGNILIRSADKVPMLGDWARARPLFGATADSVPWPGQLVGDLNYVAPEQTQSGTVEDVRSDIYALGATLYTLLTGRPPFEAGSTAKMLAKIRGEEPPRPKEFQLALPEAFEGLVQRMMHKRPDMRFQTAAEVMQGLERIARMHGLVFSPEGRKDADSR